MPKVRASSGMMGTKRSRSDSSRMSSLAVRTSAIVVATACLPEPLRSDFRASMSGTFSGVKVCRRSGT